MNARAPWGGVALAVLAACGAPVEPAVVVVPPPSSIAAAPSAAPPPPAPPRLEPLPAACPLFAALFERGRTFALAYRDTVDTHATLADGPPQHTTMATVTCIVDEVTADAGELSAFLVCRADVDGPLILAPTGFRYRDGQLWYGALVQQGEEPWLACEPQTRSFTVDQHGHACSVDIAADDERGWCRAVRCPKGGYGYRPSVHQTCFSREHGLSLLRGSNLEGPRQTEWTLAEDRPSR